MSETSEAIETFSLIEFDRLRRAYRGEIDYEGKNVYKSWHNDLQARFTIHPSVSVMIGKNLAPVNWKQLLLEYPRVSEKDPQRLAYTRSDADGANGRALVTSIGKYLSRHWPHVADHDRRDVQSMYTPDTLVFETSVPNIIRGVEDGPRSCMASVYGSIPFTEADKLQMRKWFANPEKHEPPDWNKHPYSAYRAEYGWSIALRYNPQGGIDARALLLKHGDENVFVRTYRRHLTDPNGWSEADTTLHSWLEYQGYKKLEAWPEGTRIHTPPDPYNEEIIFAPYIDGGNRGVIYDGNTTSKIVTRSYTHWCDEPSGRVRAGGKDADEDDGQRECDCCGGMFDDDYMCWVGRNEDARVCEDCRDNNYTEVTGSGRHGDFTYVIHQDCACEVGNCGEYIDPDHIPDDVCILCDGEYAYRNDCVSIDDEYYLSDDDGIVRIDDEYYLKDDDRIVHLNEPDAHGNNLMLIDDAYEDENGDYWASKEHFLEHNPVEETEET